MIYGIMHTALFALGMLPLGMTRGLWRDLANAFPGIRYWVPVDDMVYFHKVRLGCVCRVVSSHSPHFGLIAERSACHWSHRDRSNTLAHCYGAVVLPAWGDLWPLAREGLLGYESNDRGC